MSRPRPDEDAVRSQLREQRASDAAEDSPASSNGAPEAQQAEPAEAPQEESPQAEPAEAPQEESPQAEPAEAPQEEDPLAVAQRERDDYLELARRTQADFENYRKRTAKDVAAAGTRARSGLIKEILPVVDNLERALSSATDADHGLVEGVRLVHTELQGVLERAGVQAIDPAGDQFDPNVHEALSMREQDGTTSGTVVDVVEKGYRTAEQVIRPARVVVAS